MPTDRKDKRIHRFTDLERGVRADEIIFGNTGYSEEDMRFIADNTGTPIPDPDPTEPPFWNATVGNNKLVADLFFFNFPTDAVTWAIGVDGVAPTYPDDYASIPSGPPATNTLSGWAAETWRFYTADVDGTITEILTADGTSGIVVTPVDTTQIPDDVTFSNVTEAPLSSATVSNTVVITGIVAATSIAVSNATYSINGGAFTSVPGTVEENDTVALRLVSSNSYSTTTSAAVAIGARFETWSVTTVSDINLLFFEASVDIDTTIADLVWQTGGGSTPVGWIVKEDDTSLPAADDADWESAEPETFTLSDNNNHTLTARVKDALDNISNAITVTVSPPVSIAPSVTTFTASNPAPGSQNYTFNLTADAGTGTISHYIITDNDATQPAYDDANRIAWAGPYTNEAATLDALVDTTVRAYVIDDTAGLISASASAFVDTTVLGGDTAPNGDFLWINDPTTAGTYTGPRTFTGSGTLTIDGTDTGTYGGAEITTLADNNPSISITGSYTSIEIINLNFISANGTHIKIDGVNDCDITIRNCKFGLSNVNNSAVNLFKGAISLNQCNATSVDTDINILGNWFDGPDGCIILEECDSNGGAGTKVNLSCRHNFISKMVRHNSTSPSLFVTNFITGRFGSVYGDISENIYYEPTGQFYCQDILNIATFYGVDGDMFQITRNRFWAPCTDAGSNAAVQLGDKSSNRYVDVFENTFIDINTFGQFSSGHHHKFRNNKGYTSKDFPAVQNGYIFQIQRQGVDAGNMYACEFSDNTFLHYYEDGSQRGIYYPSYGRDADGTATSPNHGVCVGTCDAADNVAPTGMSTNNYSWTEWANGVGKSQLWRSSWNTFSYAGADGNTPTITYDSPWIGDGGSSEFTAASVTSTAYGDQAEVNSIQSHDLLALLSGGVAPYSLISVTAVTGCTVTLDSSSSPAIFTAGATAGSFTYTYQAFDSELTIKNGTVTGTIVDSSTGTANRFDQDGEVYISISCGTTLTDGNPYHEYYERGGASWLQRTGGGSPDGTYMQCSPYSGNVAVGDVETDSPELVYRLYFDANGTYDVYVRGMALGSANYDEVWLGFNDTPLATPFDISPEDSSYHWDDGSATLQITISSAPEKHTLHVWKKDGGFALGKIVITSGAAPTGDGPAQSPEVEN